MNSNENEDEGILGFPGMVSRPLDFRTIDIRLAMGAYRGSWETFYEDVQEVFRNLHAAFVDRTDVLEMVVAFSQSFESLYKTEVLDLVQKFHCYLSNGNTGGSEIQEELHDILTAATNLPKAPWEDSVCKVCGIDRDDDSVLLCDEDECKSGYHTYCLNPPLALIPRGNWYCPPHMPDEEEEESHLDQGVQDLHLDPGVQDSKRQRKGAESHVYYDTLVKLAAAMEKKEYWELSTQERIDMLKFLCDEMLNTVLIRQHIEQCPDKLKDLQQKFHTLNFELKDLKYKEETRTSFATPLSTLGDELPDENASTSQDNLKTSLEQAADNGEMDTLSHEISKVQESIGTVVSQLNKASLRREFLGKDSLGRLYWVLGRSGKRPLLLADGSMLIRKEGDINMVNSYPPSVFDCKGWNSASVVCYESDQEIRSLVDWLREYDPREKELKHAIQQWQWQQKHLYHLGNFDLSDPPVSKGSDNEQQQQLMELPGTKAATILEKTCRCDCLEPIWPARHHCVACHETYFTSTEYEVHAGKCSGNVVTEKDSVDPASSSRKLNSCPYDFEEICRKFVTNDSNKEVVKDIGLIGSNGVPSFVPSPAYLHEPAAVILNKNKTDDIVPNDRVSSSEESAQKLGEEGSSKSAQNCPASVGDENVSKPKKPAPESDTTSCEEEASCATDRPTRLLSVNGGLVPESALRPVIGRKSHILKQQKINLLDMDAALPEGALRASKSQQTRRRSWRAFVKRAESISEMVLATSLLETTIKSEFLRKDWWYWSSSTVAMKTSTVSSLALRIHTLDNCIMYTKEPNTITVPADSTKVLKKGRKRKEPGPSAS